MTRFALARMIAKVFFIAILLPLAGFPGPAAAAPEDDVLAAMENWAASYGSSENSEPMVALYTPDAVFWGTGGQQPFDGPADFAPYFDQQFTTFSNRKVTFHNPIIRIYGDGNFATSTGTYEFQVTLPDGQQRQVEHRYSFALVKVDGRWLIAQHHSSQMPR